MYLIRDKIRRNFICNIHVCEEKYLIYLNKIYQMCYIYICVRINNT